MFKNSSQACLSSNTSCQTPQGSSYTPSVVSWSARHVDSSQDKQVFWMWDVAHLAINNSINLMSTIQGHWSKPPLSLSLHWMTWRKNKAAICTTTASKDTTNKDSVLWSSCNEVVHSDPSTAWIYKPAMQRLPGHLFNDSILLRSFCTCGISWSKGWSSTPFLRL